jgi:hypothetical protein
MNVAAARREKYASPTMRKSGPSGGEVVVVRPSMAALDNRITPTTASTWIGWSLVRVFRAVVVTRPIADEVVVAVVVAVLSLFAA